MPAAVEDLKAKGLKRSESDLLIGKTKAPESSAYQFKTKVVCTLGPSCREKEVLKGMLRAGMNVARFNFSHGTHQVRHSPRTPIDNASLGPWEMTGPRTAAASVNGVERRGIDDCSGDVPTDIPCAPCTHTLPHTRAVSGGAGTSARQFARCGG